MFTRLRGRAAGVALAAGFATILLQAGPAAAQTLTSAPTASVPAPVAPATSVADLFSTPPAATPKSEAGLPLPVLETAAAYRLYMTRAAAQPTSFTDGASIANSLREAAAYEPQQLARGAVAFAAVAALQDETFKQSVRTLAADPLRRKQLVTLLTTSPTYSSALAGADAAAERAVAALAAESARVRTVGDQVKKAAYEVQRQPWSKAEVSDREARLAAIKAVSAVPLTGLPSDVALLQQAATVAPATSPLLADAATVVPVADTAAAAQPWPTLEGKTLPSPVVSRALTIAALTVLGEANEATIEPLLNDASCGSCLRMSKLNLYQCLAVAKPWYEDVFCLGQHVLIDTGDCIQTAAVGKGLAPAPAPAAPLPANATVLAQAPAAEGTPLSANGTVLAQAPAAVTPNTLAVSLVKSAPEPRPATPSAAPQPAALTPVALR